jgi:hypothetical protein
MKHLRLFLAVLLTVTTLTHSRPSQAGAGVLTGGVVLAGVAILGGGTAIVLNSGDGCDNDAFGICKAIMTIVLLPTVVIGMVLLDGEQLVEFKELSKTDAINLGVSSSDLEIYNSEVDQVNMLVSEVKAELSKLEKPGVEDSAVAWSSMKDLVSPATFATMQKIVSQK